jgi:tRNA pseudouridine55 synthase
MKSPPSRTPDGVLLIDKPEGCTSFDVVKKIKPWVAPLKVGHTGTLDPMATGLLPLCLGEATKLVQFLSGAPKRYLASVRLGMSTNTYDRDGREVSRSPVPDLDDTQILDCLNSFTGEIQQVPPMYSALRHRGKRMYELARKGIQVERQPRPVTIEKLTLTKRGPDWLDLDVICSAGTYIRSLAVDIAEQLGTVGHLAALTRTETDGWTIGESHQPDSLLKERLPQIVIPLEAVLARFDRVDVDYRIGLRLQQGQHLSSPELESLGVQSVKHNKIIWFRAPTGHPLVLAELSAIGMRIMRVLLPTKTQ